MKVAAGMRGLVRPERPADDDVPDPYGYGADAYRLPFDLISGAVDIVTGLMVPT